MRKKRKKTKQTGERVIYKDPEDRKHGAKIIKEKKGELTIQVYGKGEVKTNEEQITRIKGKENTRKSLRKLRKENSMTQGEVASCLWMTATAYSKIERGETKSISLDSIRTLSALYGKKPSEILDEMTLGKEKKEETPSGV